MTVGPVHDLTSVHASKAWPGSGAGKGDARILAPLKVFVPELRALLVYLAALYGRA